MNLKSKAASNMRPLESSLQEHDIFNLSNNKSILLNKMRCKDYYALFQEKAEIIPTSVKSWSKKYPNVADKWKELFHNIPRLSIDNKLKQFSFKLLHRILVKKKELKRFKIAPNDECFSCKRPDSLEHAFLEWRLFNITKSNNIRIQFECFRLLQIVTTCYYNLRQVRYQALLHLTANCKT